MMPPETGKSIDIGKHRIVNLGPGRNGNPVYEVQKNSRGAFLRTGHGYQDFGAAVFEARRLAERQVVKRPEPDPLVGRVSGGGGWAEHAATTEETRQALNARRAMREPGRGLPTSPLQVYDTPRVVRAYANRKRARKIH